MRPTILVLGALLLASSALATTGHEDELVLVRRDQVAFEKAPAANVLVVARMDPLRGIHGTVLTVERPTGPVSPIVAPAVLAVISPRPIAHSSGGMPG